ncbi:MAG: hypothetical protein LBT05_07960 [Planctomycetaceae bacterium]|jgi:hypothetical protein|nr:hypothetical protein [Planctomycetaceae bacterium]
MNDDLLLTDLIPKRLGTYWFLFFLGMGCVVVLVFCYYKMPDLCETTKLQNLAAFDLAQRHSIASWFVTIFWITASLYSILIYFVSSHDQDFRRLSDIWVWGAIACLYLSLDQTACLREIFRDIMIRCTGTNLYGNGDIWWIAVYFLIFGMIGTRILTEIRHYLPACNSLLMAGISFIISGCVKLELIQTGENTTNTILCVGSVIVGCQFLLLSITLYGRKVIVTDPETYNYMYSSIWRKLSRRVTPTLYKYNNSERYDSSDEYHNSNARSSRQRSSAKSSRLSSSEYWDDNEDEEDTEERETIRRRQERFNQGRLKKKKKGVFY